MTICHESFRQKTKTYVNKKCREICKELPCQWAQIKLAKGADHRDLERTDEDLRLVHVFMVRCVDDRTRATKELCNYACRYLDNSFADA